MLGYHVSVYRQPDGGASPPSFGAAHGPQLAIWQTGSGGLAWIDELVKQKKAVFLGGGGYPLQYTAMAGDLRNQITEGPPCARDVWCYDPGDILSPGWQGKTTTDPVTLGACRPDEWLLIEAWDES